MNGCNVSFAVSQIEDCLELNFRYVDYQTLAHLSCSSCVYWISARATRAQHFLSVRESISASMSDTHMHQICHVLGVCILQHFDLCQDVIVLIVEATKPYFPDPSKKRSEEGTLEVEAAN